MVFVELTYRIYYELFLRIQEKNNGIRASKLLNRTFRFGFLLFNDHLCLTPIEDKYSSLQVGLDDPPYLLASTPPT